MLQHVETRGNQFAPVPPERDSAGITAQEFAEELFECEYCAECYGDIKDHLFVIGPFGTWFAFCKNDAPADE